MTIAFNSSTTTRSIDIYGSNTAYTAATDLYGDKAGTKLASIAANADSKTLTVDGDYTFVGLRSNNGAIYIDKITIVWEESGSSDTRTATTIEFADGYQTKFTYGPQGESVALPTATVKAGDTPVNATVTWELTKGADFVVGDEEPAIDGSVVKPSNHSYGKLNLTASYAGDASNKPASKSYTLTVYKGYMSLAEMLEDVTNGNEKWKTGVLASYWGVLESSMSAVVSQVIYSNGSYTYINDGTTNMLLYGSGLGLTAGSLISGDAASKAIYGTLKNYNGLPEFAVSKNDIEFTVVSEGPTPTPTTITVDKLGDNINAYVQIVDAEYVSASSKNLTFTVGEASFTVYNQWNVAVSDLVAGAKYTLTGMGSVYNTSNQLYLISFDKTADPTGINAVEAAKTLQNGAIYNVAGQQVTKSYKGLVIKNGKKVVQK